MTPRRERAMPSDDTGRPWLPWLVIVVAGSALFLPGLGGHDLWNPDEPRYAEVAREMVESGRYLVPQLNGAPYGEKPPIHFWAISLAATLRGEVDEVAARLPSAAAAIGTLLLLFAIARRLFGGGAAWLSVALFATCLRVTWQARYGQIDMLLTFWVTLAMYFWLRGYLERRLHLYRLFFLATGIATLTKGPAGFLPPLLAVVAFLLMAGEREELRRMQIGRGLLIWAGVALLWLVPAAVEAGGEYFRRMLLVQNVKRFTTGFVDANTGHLRPWYYYLRVLPTEFFPWSLFFPTALLIGWRERLSRYRHGLLFAFCWAAVTLVFFSLSPGKRSVYILTMYPAVALLVGWALDRALAAWPRYRGWVVVPAALAALIWGLVVALFPVVALSTSVVEDHPNLVTIDPSAIHALRWLFLPACLGAALGAALAWRVPRAALATLVASTALTFVAAVVYGPPTFDPIKSHRPLANELLARLGEGEPYAMYPRLEPGYLFYLRRPTVLTEREEELRAFVAAAERPWVIARVRDFERLAPALSLTEIYRGNLAKDGWAIFGRPEGEASR